MKRVLKTVAVAFIIALILILIKNEYARCLPASTYGMQAAIRKERVDNLFIGSSMFRQGLDIDVLEAELPGSSYILSYNGNQPALMALELQYMLEQGLQVKICTLICIPTQRQPIPGSATPRFCWTQI